MPQNSEQKTGEIKLPLGKKDGHWRMKTTTDNNLKIMTTEERLERLESMVDSLYEDATRRSVKISRLNQTVYGEEL